MSDREPVSVIELDIDYCSRTFGEGMCGAALGTAELRENLFLYSGELDNAYWTKTRATVSADAVTAPDGTLTADRLIDNATSGTHLIQRTMSFTSGLNYAMSVYARPDTLSNLRFIFTATAFGTLYSNTFTLTGDGSFSGGAGYVDAGIEKVDDDWYRCWVVRTATATASSILQIRLDNGSTDSYSGTSSGLWLWNMQLEVGDDPSPYIITGAETATGVYKGAERKCYNTWNTCKFKRSYDKSIKTLSYCQPNAGIPVGTNIMPAVKSVSGRSGTVNVAGSDQRLDALGSRESITVNFSDFTDNDRLTDKYWRERITGAAQIDEGGYQPSSRGSHFTKLKKRSPNYAGRGMRHKQGYIVDGAFVLNSTRHFAMTEIDGPNTRGDVTVKGLDILDLANKDKAVAPKASRGFLRDAITAIGTTATLLPEGIGEEYAASGVAVVGSEIVEFTRAGDVLTFTTRGARATVAAAHSVNDTVQEVFSCRRERIDSVLYRLLVDYAGIDAAFVPTADWADEVIRWAPQLVLTADICKPEGVATLIGEMAVLGVTIWWDSEAQEIKLKVNRPPDTDTVSVLNDAVSNIDVKQIDKEDARLTRVSFWTVQIDPTKALAKDNFLRGRVIVDVDAESPKNYNGQRIREIYCRWLNHGADALVRVQGRRILNRFNKQPVEYEITLDHKDDVALVDVVDLTTRVATDETGKAERQFAQVIKREDVKNGHSIKVTTQRFPFDGRYAYICENARPLYNASSQAQKDRGAYFVGTTLLFDDGTGPYVFS